MYKKILFLVFVLFCLNLSYSYENVSICGTLSTAGEEYRLNQSLPPATGTCLTINNDSITLDCQGYNITGDGSGNGISFSSTNITIRNCEVYSFQYNYLITTLNNYIYDSIGNSPTNNDLVIDTNGQNYIENFISKDFNGLSSGPINLVSTNHNILKEISIINNSESIVISITGTNNSIIFSNLSNANEISSVAGNYFYGNYFSNYSVVDGIASGNYFNYSYQGNNIGNYWEDLSCLAQEYRGSYPVCTSPSNYTINSSSSLYDYAPLANMIPVGYFYPNPDDKSIIKSGNITFKIRDIYNDVDNAKVYIDGTDYALTRTGEYWSYAYTLLPSTKTDISFYVTYNSDTKTLPTRTFTYFPDDTNTQGVPGFGFYSVIFFILMIFGGLIKK